MKPIQQRKLLRAVEKMKSLSLNMPEVHKQSPVVSNTAETASAISLPMEVDLCSSSLTLCDPSHLITSANGASTSKDKITIKYVHCQDLFMYQAEEKAINNLDPTTSLGELVTLIEFAEGVSEDLALELFFSEGYPLDANSITLKGTAILYMV